MDLYKLDTKGKLRIKTIECIGPVLIQTSGLVAGEKVTHEKTISGKNIGKVNELTPEEACISKRDSLIKKALREGYYETEEQARSEIIIKPMLAEKYENHKDAIDYNSSYIQPKLDGMRCVTELDGEGGVIMKSRGQKILSGTGIFTHIEEQLANYRGMPIIIDGELYAHGKDLQENMKLCKKFRPGETDVLIRYNIYDTISEQPFHIRVKRVGFYSEHVVEVKTTRVYNEIEIEEKHKEHILDGYEGSIIRHGESQYEMKRTKKLLKKKDFEDVVAQVIDIVPQEADPTKGKLFLELIEGEHTGVRFYCSYNGTHEFQKELLAEKDKYIGETAEVRFFGYTQDGVPNIAKVHGFRLDK